MGRRIRKQTSQGTIWFLYADEGLIAELDQTGNPVRYYGWKPDGLWSTDPLWLAEKSRSNWQAYLYHNDHLWTPQRLTDHEGNIQWSGRAEAFGKTAATTNAIDNPLSFPGQYEDADAMVTSNYLRFYDVAMGRYMQSDSIGVLDGEGKYEYARGAPLRYFDIYGASPMQCCDDEGKSDADRCRDRAWPAPQNGIEVAGRLICCGGRKVPCENPNRTRSPDSRADSIISTCTLKHEREHIPHGKECDSCGNVPSPPP